MTHIQDGQYAQLEGGIRLHYASSGAKGAPLLLFVHGFPEFWWEWHAQLAHFGQTHFAVAPDLRGFNLSSKPAGAAHYKPKLIMQDLVQLIEHLGYRKAIVVAHDWGGAICWNLAIKAPQWVEKLIIINSPHPYIFMRELASNPAQQKSSEYMNWLRTPGSESALAKSDFKLLEGFFNGMGQPEAPWFDAATRARYHAAWKTPGDDGTHSLSGGVNYYRASPLHPPTASDPGPAALALEPEDWTVRVPTKVIWGEADFALPTNLLNGIEQVVPQLDLTRIAGGTHWVVHEQPERINALIEEYLRKKH
ncbi:MAG: alpha/beta fold hydrolase [Burkholderiaceae bacterium]